LLVDIRAVPVVASPQRGPRGSEQSFWSSAFRWNDHWI